MPRKMTKTQVCNAVAKSLVEFGYADVDGHMIGEVLAAWLEGKRFPDLPHGVIGAMAERQFDEVTEAGADLSKLED